MKESLFSLKSHTAIKGCSREVQEEITRKTNGVYLIVGQDFTVIGAEQTQVKYMTLFLTQQTLS